MALELVVDNLENVDENVRGFYVEHEGKFNLDPAAVTAAYEKALEEKNAVSNAIKKANKEAQDERLRRKAYEKLGMPPDEIEAAITELNALKQKREEDDTKDKMDKGQFESLKQQMNEAHAREVNKLKLLIDEQKQKNTDLRKRIEQHLIQSSAISAIAENKGVPQLLLPVVKSHIQVEEMENGDFNLKVVDEKGESVVDGKGDPLSVKEFVRAMQSNEIYSRAFEGSGSAGGGMRPGNGGQPPTHSYKRKTDFKSEKERAEFVDKHGMAAYNALPMN